jgi:hypothetical protein
MTEKLDSEKLTKSAGKAKRIVVSTTQIAAVMDALRQRPLNEEQATNAERTARASSKNDDTPYAFTFMHVVESLVDIL